MKLSYLDCVRTGKIEARKMKENVGNNSQRASVNSVSAGIEDFCETFERTVKPVVVRIMLSVSYTSFAVAFVKFLAAAGLLFCVILENN